VTRTSALCSFARDTLWRFRAVLSVFFLLVLCCPGPRIDSSGEVSVRRVNAPYSAGDVDWAQTAIFWFGQNEHYSHVPGRNYTDVRIAYTDQALRVRFTVVDYYLWYQENATLAHDLTQYDAAVVYLDTGFDRSATPQTDDYWFLVGARHWPNENAPAYHRQARGAGAGWDTSWSGEWTDNESMQWWCNPGPNSNECGIDFGWTAILTIPWSTLGLSGPPDEGTLWGLGVQLYDRDDSAASGLADPEHWPQTFGVSNPASWAELHFGYADFEPPAAVPEGTTVIRASSPTDNAVEDAWMGGGGTCSGGHEGGSEVNHGDSSDLFVGTETAPTHFPCFSKSYLRFSLDSLPPGKTVLSASLTLHLQGNAGDPGQAQPSWVHLFTVSDPWDEMTIHWNNAPLAQENVAASWVYPVTSFPGWPGIPYHWDATQAVAEAYAESRPLSLALYSADVAQHSSKYLVSSETGDWNAAARPTLNVVWGQRAVLSKSAQTRPAPAEELLGLGGVITYTVQVIGSGQALTMTDALPAQVGVPLTQMATFGSVAYEAASHTLSWTGTPAAGQVVTVTYPVMVIQGGTYALLNTAHMTTAGGSDFSSSATVFVEPRQGFLPLALKE
jgi:hypothetical protein